MVHFNKKSSRVNQIDNSYSEPYKFWKKNHFEILKYLELMEYEHYFLFHEW